MPSILILNGPNLNLLGLREPHIYGSETLQDVENMCRELGRQYNITVETFQSNHEGHLIDRIHEARNKVDVIVINPAGYTHTSVAIRDALLGVSIPFIEVHLSNIHAREQWRHHSYFSDKAAACIIGLGTFGYEAAIQFAVWKLMPKSTTYAARHHCEKIGLGEVVHAQGNLSANFCRLTFSPNPSGRHGDAAGTSTISSRPARLGFIPPYESETRPFSLRAKTHQVTIFIAPVYYLTETMMEDKLHGARLQREPAASTTQVPTVNSKQNMMRFSSSSASLQEDSGTKSAMSPAAGKSGISDQDHRSSENMVKAALTEFLNDADVKSNPDGNKCIQNLLMKTEREWKEQRRHSIHQRAQE